MVDNASPHGVVTKQARLRGYGPVFLVFIMTVSLTPWGLAQGVEVFLYGRSRDFDGSGVPGQLIATLFMATLFWLWVGYRRGVRLSPSGLVPHTGASALTPMRWDEIDSVRLDKVRSLGPLTYYGPVLEMHSGEEVLLNQLVAPATARRLPRSRPAHHVATIAAYSSASGHAMPADQQSSHRSVGRSLTNLTGTGDRGTTQEEHQWSVGQRQTRWIPEGP